MNTVDNLIFLSPISIRLPSELYGLIESDARLFGFIKNKKANINGFLNELLPSIVEMQMSTPINSPIFANMDEDTTKKLQGISLYFENFFKPLLKGNSVTVSFRVNKAHEKDFLDIYQNILGFYNMDFSLLVRSLLTYYIINRLAIRERFLYFRNYDEISNAIAEKKECLFFLKGETLRFSPVTLIVSPYSDRNILLGIEQETGISHVMPFHLINKVIAQKKETQLTKRDLKYLKIALQTYLKNEKSNSKTNN